MIMVIPRNAKRAFKGILFDVYQWKQKMFDGSIEEFEAVRRVPSVQVIAVTNAKKILLLRESQPGTKSFISLPGGMVRKNEAPRQAARRELLEEAGFRPRELVPWKKTNIGGKIQWDTHYFIARGCEKASSPERSRGEKISVFEKDFKGFIKETQKKNFRNKGFSSIILGEMAGKQKKGSLRKQIFK
jgi:ADP-ribose pyrophosphatase